MPGNSPQYWRLKRSSSPQSVRNIAGQGWVTTSFPPEFFGTSLPASSTTFATTPKNGSVAEPGFCGMAPGSGVIMIMPVSVCHHVSTTGQRLRPIVL